MIHTCQQGPSYTIPGTFTMRNILQIIDKLNTMMQYTFEPEAITEGGLCIKNLNYKTIRLGFDNWPCITNGQVEPEDMDVPLEVRDAPRTNEVHTFLKAFNNATPWTMEELEQVDLALIQGGFVRCGNLTRMLYPPFKCKNSELCEYEGEPSCLDGYWSIPGLCMNCVVLFRKELIFKNGVECPVCYETKRGVMQPKCEHSICLDCFKSCYYGKYEDPVFPYSSDVQKEYNGFTYGVPASFLDMYPLIEEYENESDRRFNKQMEMIRVNSRCPICRK